MNSRERVLKTFRFEKTDRPPCDLMEGTVWPELLAYFRRRRGLEDKFDILDFLGLDFRWTPMRNLAAEARTKSAGHAPEATATPLIQTKEVARGPLADATCVADVESFELPNPEKWQPGDYAGARQRWPEHALVCGAGWHPLFWSACEAFGVEAALTAMLAQPEVFDRFIQRLHEFYMGKLRRMLAAAKGHCDICWLGDDFASQQSMFISPDHWRKFIRPRLAEQAALIRDHGLYALYHSCGAVRPILKDLIDIGINGLVVFQTTATNMTPESIAEEFGGRLVFYGGIDVQQLLSFGSRGEVRETVRRNTEAFADCGGYVVANSHHGVSTIKGENIEAMFKEARGGS